MSLLSVTYFTINFGFGFYLQDLLLKAREKEVIGHGKTLNLISFRLVSKLNIFATDVEVVTQVKAPVEEEWVSETDR